MVGYARRVKPGGQRVSCTLRATIEVGNDLSDELDSPVKHRPVLRVRALMMGLGCGTATGVILLLIALVFLARDATPRVTPEVLAAAESRWEKKGPPSYNLDLVLTGSQTGEIHIEVRNGVVERMTRDGRSPKQRRTWDYWSVPNQFAMIEQDLETAKNPQKAFGVTTSEQVVMRANFHPQFGYPAYYQRTVMGGTNQVEWRITRFEVVSQ